MTVDEELIKACRSGNDAAQRELYILLHEPLMQVCMKYYVNEEDAMTVMHDGVLKIFKSLRKFKYDKSFVNWCRVLMINVVLDDIRRNKRRKYFERYDTEKAMRYADELIIDPVDREIQAQYVEDVLKVIPLASRIVFSLYVFEEYKHKEIAKKLRISEGTSKWHVATAKKILRQHLTLPEQSTNSTALQS